MIHWFEIYIYIYNEIPELKGILFNYLMEIEINII